MKQIIIYILILLIPHFISCNKIENNRISEYKVVDSSSLLLKQLNDNQLYFHTEMLEFYDTIIFKNYIRLNYKEDYCCYKKIIEIIEYKDKYYLIIKESSFQNEYNKQIKDSKINKFNVCTIELDNEIYYKIYNIINDCIDNTRIKRNIENNFNELNYKKKYLVQILFKNKDKIITANSNGVDLLCKDTYNKVDKIIQQSFKSDSIKIHNFK